MRPKPVVLMTLSGVGIARTDEGNALRQAKMPAFSHLLETYPAMLLEASGSAVGLSKKRGGSSEASHRTIGLGRIWQTSVSRAEASLIYEEQRTPSSLRSFFNRIKREGGRLHLIGLLSDAETYARFQMIPALVRIAVSRGVEDIAIHVILDGVDAQSDGGLQRLIALEASLKEIGFGYIASLCGRSFGMDHDLHWDLTKKSYQAIIDKKADHAFKSPQKAIESFYAKDIYDVDIPPTIISSAPNAPVEEHDGLLFWNLRPYGMRQLVKACSLPGFAPFARRLNDIPYCMTLTEYEKDLPVQVAFSAHIYEECLGRTIADAGLRQLRIAEAERYAHVSVFFNGMQEEVMPGEDRVIIPSPPFADYSQVPEMSMNAVTDRIVKEIAGGTYDVIIGNLCAPEFLARTGNEQSCIKACEAMDKCIQRISDATLAVGGMVFFVGDHGRAESIRDIITGMVRKEGTTNPVPFLSIGKQVEGLKAIQGDVVGGDLSSSEPSGTLADVAPTILHYLELPIPKEMTGTVLKN